jgi:hypothetical protein
MKKEIKINPNGGRIITNVRIQGLVVAGYFLQLFKPASTEVIAGYSGNNESDHDNARTLPDFAIDNVGRVLMLDTTIAALDEQVVDRTCTVSLEIYQDDHFVDAAKDVRQLSNEVQQSLILVKLI